MQAEITANVNNAECIRSVIDFGQTTYHNICTGTSTVLPWGTMDYIGIAVLAGIGLLLAGLLVGFLVMMMGDLL